MNSKRQRRFELTIPSRLEEMQAVHALIAEAVKEYKLSSEMAHWIELSISESMINAIQHGNRADPAKQATLRISSSGDAIEIIVEDEGKGFTLDKIADHRTHHRRRAKAVQRGVRIHSWVWVGLGLVGTKGRVKIWRSESRKVQAPGRLKRTNDHS